MFQVSLWQVHGPSASVQDDLRHSQLFIRIHASHLSILCVLYELTTVHLAHSPPPLHLPCLLELHKLKAELSLFCCGNELCAPEFGYWLRSSKDPAQTLRSVSLCSDITKTSETPPLAAFGIPSTWGVETLYCLPNHRWQLLTSSFMLWIWGGNCDFAFFCKNASCAADLEKQPQVFKHLCSLCVY